MGSPFQCDETQPHCRNCIHYNLGLECAYREPMMLTPSESVTSTSLGRGILSSPSPSNDGSTEGISLVHNQAHASMCTACGMHHTDIFFGNYEAHPDFPSVLPPCVMTLLVPLKKSPVPRSTRIISSVVSQDGSSAQFNALVQYFTHGISHTFTIPHSTGNIYEITRAWSRVSQGDIANINEYPFVLQAIAAAAACHLNTTASIPLAEENYRMALMGVSTELKKSGITSQNCDAIFATLMASSIILVSKVGRRFGKGHYSSSHNRTGRHLNLSWVLFARATVGILQASASKSPLFSSVGPMLRSYPHVLPISRVLSKRTEFILSRLEGLCFNHKLGPQHELGDMETSKAYFQTVWNLRRLWAVLEESCVILASQYAQDEASGTQLVSAKGLPRAIRSDYLGATILQFVGRVPPRFWECLKKRRPRALIIYAYYIVGWGGLSFGSGIGLEQGPWWVEEKVEEDLMAIQEELNIISSDTEEGYNQEIVNEWMSDAWQVFHGLRDGWWIDGGTATNG